MMGVTHYATGICAGAYVAWGVRAALVPAPAPITHVAVGVAGAAALTWLAGRAAYWPDLDHQSSSATRRWGPLSRLVHETVEYWSKATFDRTATPADVRAGDFRNHRGLTHFAVTALGLGLVLGVAVWQVTLRWPSIPWGVAAGLFAGWAATRSTRSEWAGLAVALGTGWLVARHVPVPVVWDVTEIGPVLGLGVGISVATGMLAHDLGDAATLAGVPLLWPVRIRGQRYYPIHIRRRANRTRTGAQSSTEVRLRGWSWVLTVVAVLGWIPGLLSGAVAMVAG